MPFSRSRSPESMTRSFTDWLSRKAPDCHSMASTNVVLPWSTWATMATLRISSRVCIGIREGSYLPPGRSQTPRLGFLVPAPVSYEAAGQALVVEVPAAVAVDAG